MKTRKIISLLSAAAVLLGTVSGTYAADTAALSPRASVVLDSESGYIKGITDVPSAGFIKAQFEGDVTVVSPDGETLADDKAVPADSTVKAGGAELAKVLVAGDVSRDGKINLSDASAMLQHIAKWSVEVSTAAADLDGSGSVTLSDVSTLLKYVAKWDVALSTPAELDLITSGAANYKLLANNAETDAAFVAEIKDATGVELQVVETAAEGESYITVGTDLCDKYGFIDKNAADAVAKDKAYVDTYAGNIYVCVKGEDGALFAAETIAAEFDGESLGLPRGYAGPVTHMTERGALYWDAVANIEKTEPVTDGTNGMNEDILVAINNANYTEPKNIIYMIGDGMGKNIAVAAKYCHIDDLYGGELTMNYLPVEGRQSTYSTSDQITDSAAGGTALATGFKTTNSTISMNTDDTAAYKTLLELAAEKGKSTGIIATKTVTDATPATFTAHVGDRSEQLEIAGQQLSKLTDGTLDLVLGGGSSYYDDGSNAAVRAAAKERGVTYTKDWDVAQSAELPLAGLFATENMPTDGTDPHIAAMTDLALDLLSEDENGFFLMVEGSKIDTYGHSNDFGAEIDETYEFDCAIAVALRFVALNPDTVLVITADHETGELAISNEPTPENIRDSGRYSSGGHHWVDVPVYAVGYGTEALAGNQENTDVAIFLAGLMGEENFGQRSETYELFDVTDSDNVSAIIARNDCADAVTVAGGGLLVNYGKGEGKVTNMYVPKDVFELPTEEYDTITAFRVTMTNKSDDIKRLPSCGVKMEDGSLYNAGERITYIKPGETITYTYNLDARFRHTGSLAKVEEFVIYSTAGYTADILISDITAVSRPLDK
ncbi:MAG: alkaline phosphatase [Clostridia bacterium]|nr:alkaline phosphatase [Clostridia bacterium]